MKKLTTDKKLSLHAETIRSLDHADLRAVAGASGSGGFLCRCNVSTQATSATKQAIIVII